MKRFSTVLFVLVSGLMMTACGAGPSATATETATGTATITAEPTAVINATPGVPVITGTESFELTAPADAFISPLPPAELLAQLNINPDRTYTVIDNYYVDTYNNAKWAVLDNGVWRETTPEEKYGHLAPLNPSEPYQNPKILINGDVFHSGDRNYQSYSLYAVWTGDIVKSQGEVQGIFVMRDLNGELIQLKVRLYSPDVPGKFNIFVTKQISANTSSTRPETGEPADLLPLGQQIELSIYYQVPKNAELPSLCDASNGMCTDQNNVAFRKFLEQEAEIQAFINDLRAGKKVAENPELVLIPRDITEKK